MSNRQPSAQTIHVLSAFLDSPNNWLYGYDLSKRLGLSSGTLYPILMRLTDRGQLETRWVQPDTPGRPPRHIYRLSNDGRTWAVGAVADDLHKSRGTLRPAEATA